MNKIYFKFKEHPGDLFRNTDIIELPNPCQDLESFFVNFLNHYQSDNRVSELDDLYKFIYNEFDNQKAKNDLIVKHNLNSNEDAQLIINSIEDELKNEAFGNFYNFLLDNKIELIQSYEKQ